MSEFNDWLAEQGIESEMEITIISPRQFHAKPQVGSLQRMTWSAFTVFLSEPSIGDDKGCAGGYSPALYTDNIRRKANLVRIWLLVVDVDGHGDVDIIADELSAYDTVVHSTFSSTDDDPRCRVILRLAEPIDADTYEKMHLVVRSKLRSELGAMTDDGAKDASRLSYLPVRREGAGYRFRVTRGRPLDAVGVVARLPPPPPRPRVEIAPQHQDAYKRAALRRAAENIGAAHEGARHETLCREAFGLARLGLTASEIRDALLPSAVAAMGESRRREAERTIGDAVRARTGGSR